MRSVPLAQIELTREEAGVEVREDDALVPATGRTSVGNVLVGLALGVDAAATPELSSTFRYEACASQPWWYCLSLTGRPNASQSRKRPTGRGELFRGSLRHCAPRIPSTTGDHE